jgi:hypothetical protein
MSHIRCHECGSDDHVQGYGFAAGPLGGYTMCSDCGATLELTPDLEGLTAPNVEYIEAAMKRWVEGVNRVREMKCMPLLTERGVLPQEDEKR